VKNFWAELPKPFFVLAPLANVTDAAFRRLIAKYADPSIPRVMYTEFVSADGLMKGNRDVLMRDLLFTEAERPIVAQFFTSDPEMMRKAAALAQQLGFDGVDINMGCPDKSVEKQGAGAKLMLNPAGAVELIKAAKRGAPNLPVSVKTRLGYNKDILEAWLPSLLAAEPAVVTLHARTRKEMSLVPARWERVARAVEIRDEMKSSTLIVGNGDLQDLADAHAKVAASHADGAMLGRAIFGNPWLFAKTDFPEENSLEAYSAEGAEAARGFFRKENLSKQLRVAVEHTKLFEELLGDIKSFAIMKKHFKAYVASPVAELRPREGFPGAKELRLELMETKSAAEVEHIIEVFLKTRG
jgi:nifR3 family TIM-barrel protein